MRSVKIAVALSLVAQVAGAQVNRSAGAPVSELKSWSTPWDGRPRDPFADRQGRVWFVGQEGNYVGRLDPKNGEFKRYEVDPGTHPPHRGTRSSAPTRPPAGPLGRNPSGSGTIRGRRTY